MAVTHAVKARQVRRSLCRSDHVVRRDRQLGLRQADVDQRGAELFQLGQRGAYRGAYVIGQAFAKILLGQTDAQAGQRACGICALQRLAEQAAEVFHVATATGFQTGGIAWVKAGHGRQQQRAIFGRARHRAALVQRRSESDHAVARHAAVRRLDPGNARERCRLADRAAGVRSGCSRRQIGRHRCRRAARRAARHVLEVPRVLDRAERRVLVGRAHREFVHVGLAQRHHAGRAQALDHGGVKRADVVAEHLGARRGTPAAGDEHVLVRDRDAGQRRRVAGRNACVGGPRLGKRRLGVDMGKGVEMRPGLDARQVMARQFLRRNLFGGELGGQGFDRGCGHRIRSDGLPAAAGDVEWSGLKTSADAPFTRITAGYSITLGTRYRPASVAGAHCW